ncbi:nucleotidyltransferase substrate binding protein [Flavobacterium urumqiense]|uniref:Nucleotidyltransferase substrate binding protein, HI0074 family n=1 Tax=Flavobacterium urumqiense TaxID=935224 RepID=A0A1H5Y1C3_9FLAO|nr:nucleotidyltransferase substrate binding protein [Flavobacterium urumqiense]SEG17400.1 nucleotidyltransferase substrate binding protein, HI0074 family [Flavobacterium urumqiense]
MEEDIRWKQRFGNYLKALGQLQKFIVKGNLNELEEQGLIQAFGFTHELAWNVMQDYFEYQGNTTITGSRDAMREAFQKGLIQDGAQWMEMIKSRNQSTHTYNESTANENRDRILNYYYDLFVSFKEKMKEL